jgi:hypothetical protein
MGCEVCIGGDYGDCDGSPEFQDVTYPKARKEHRCVECRRLVPKGEQYQKWVMKFDGDLSCDKTCSECAEIRQVFSCGEMQPQFGQLWQEMHDNAFPYLTTGSECFRELSAKSKGFVLDKWRQWKGLTQ